MERKCGKDISEVKYNKILKAEKRLQLSNVDTKKYELQYVVDLTVNFTRGRPNN